MNKIRNIMKSDTHTLHILGQGMNNLDEIKIFGEVMDAYMNKITNFRPKSKKWIQ